ncbi:hypothetical protein CUR86_05055 [Salinicola acroporae]|uniref:Uncharacterized protein n=1 Tax=Salinicola acroporae TaxID=1541440 RepID=A0ABT6I2I9_9GAMM|nr:hypothetical protein [Salinicola acroporae]
MAHEKASVEQQPRGDSVEGMSGPKSGDGRGLEAASPAAAESPAWTRGARRVPARGIDTSKGTIRQIKWQRLMR